MSSDSEEEFQENSESDREETDSIASIEDLDIDETQKKNDLLEQKLKIVLGYNASTLDLYEFNKSLKKINNELESLELVTEYSNSDLVNREYSLIELLENYINMIRQGAQPGFINEYKHMEINRLNLEIKQLRAELIREVLNDDEPFESMNLDEMFDVLIAKEEEYIKKVVAKLNKRLTTKLVIPRRTNYQSDREYNQEYIKFYRTISKYIKGECISQHMNVTSLGSSYDKFEKSVREQYLESIKLLQELPIKVSASDRLYFMNKVRLKQIMMKVSENHLVECASEVEVYNILQNEITRSIGPLSLQKIKRVFARPPDLNAVITTALRNKTIQEFNKEINNQNLVKTLENEIFVLTQPSFVDYTSKIKDILFIFRNYPNFKNYLIESRISINQFVLFEKEIAFETIINVSSIKTRRNNLKTIKEVLLKNKIYKNGLVNNYKCNILAKRLELLVLDISKDSRIYNGFYQKLLKFINQNRNKIFEMDIQDILLYLKGEEPSKSPKNYSRMNLSDIRALISQEKNKIEELNRKRSILQKDIISWECPLSVKSDERRQWESLLRQGDLNKIIKYRKMLLKRYSLPEDFRITLLIAKIIESNERLDKLKSELPKAEARQENIFVAVDYPEVKKKEITIIKPSDLINESIQSYKRRLMTDSLTVSQSDKNKVISLLELLDLNDISDKNAGLQKKLITDINLLLPKDYKFFDFNNFYYNASRESLKIYFKPYSLNYLDLAGNLPVLTSVSYNNLKDFYGEIIFDKLKRSKRPEDFYSQQIQREYINSMKRLKVNLLPEYRRLKVLYNPYTGKFGQEAQDGYLFDVEKLSISGDGKPLEDMIVHESIDPRTNQMVYEKVMVVVPGKHPFIKVPVLGNKRENYIWLAVRPELAKMYPTNYDTCSRFDNNSSSCTSGKGLGNSSCIFNESTKKCTTSYNLLTNFGKSKTLPLKKVILGKRKLNPKFKKFLKK